jgi:hypothetical protein
MRRNLRSKFLVCNSAAWRIAAAVANAVYHATGKRMTSLPITLEKLCYWGWEYIGSLVSLTVISHFVGVGSFSTVRSNASDGLPDS